MCRVILLALLLTLPASAADPAPLWLEAELPTRTNLPAGSPAPAAKAALSADHWLDLDLTADRVPADGGTLAYDFTLPAAGSQQVWLRLDADARRSPVRWKLDDGAWSDVPPDDPTIDVSPVGDRVLGWKRLAGAELTAGKHTLTLLFSKPAKGNLRFAADCIAVVPAFIPNGKHQPGAKWQTAFDREAADHAHSFPPSAAVAADRRTLPLNGLWQLAKFDPPGDPADRATPLAALPTDLAARPWRGVELPAAALPPEFAFTHRLLYRTRFTLPEKPASAVVLRFPNNPLLTAVFLNGVKCGESAVPGVPWACDVTAAVARGKENELVVAVSDAYFAVARAPDGKPGRTLFTVKPTELPSGIAVDFPVDPRTARAAFDPPTVSLEHPVAVADVVVRPSVANKTLALDVTVTNRTAQAATVSLHPTVKLPGPDGKAVLTFDAKQITVPAGKTETVTLSKAWPDVPTWWPEQPKSHVAEVEVRDGETAVDRFRVSFGFREWGTADGRFTLNGVPWAMRADAGRPTGNLDAWAKAWRRGGRTLLRVGDTRGDFLDFADTAGVPLGRKLLESAEGFLTDGKANRPLFDRWLARAEAVVRNERSHAALFAWEVPEPPALMKDDIAVAVAKLRQLDPTRPVVFSNREPLPPTKFEAEPQSGSPLIVEFAGTPTRRTAEALRWQRRAAVEAPVTLPDADISSPWRPVAVVSRDAETTFDPGAKVVRRLKVFNDTDSAAPVAVHWLFQTPDGLRQQRGKKAFDLKPGGSEEFTVELDAFPLGDRARLDVDLVFSCFREDVELFRDVRNCRFLKPLAGPATDAKPNQVAVFDPHKRLGDIGKLTASTAIDDWRKLSDGCRVLVVAPDAVTAADCDDPAWTALAVRGVRIVVLDQAFPLRFIAVPDGIEPTAGTGTAVTLEAGHPALDGLADADFAELGYRLPYRKPSRGGAALARAGDLAPLVECPVRDGLMLLSQFEMGENSTLARRHLANLLHRAWTWKPEAKAEPDPVFAPTVNLRYGLIPFGEKCNAAVPDLPTLPRGEKKIGNVLYEIRDGAEKWVVALDGVTEVADIRVKQTGDALFFLHSVRPAADTKPGDTVFEYVLSYATGETEVIPVRLGREVGPLRTAERTLLTNGGIAWRDELSTVYQMRWVNPHPKAEITSLTVRKPAGSKAVAVVFAATAADKK